MLEVPPEVFLQKGFWYTEKHPCGSVICYIFSGNFFTRIPLGDTSEVLKVIFIGLFTIIFETLQKF